MTGNWPSFKQDTDGNGTWDLNQSRTHDAANEITQIAGISSHVAHDRAGNMVKTPKPDAWSAHYDLTFDAWNRLVKVMDGVTVVATYAYDGRNFRVTKTVSGTTRHLYYNNAWQCLEERLPIPNPQSLIPVSQHVWGLRYIDDLVLRDRDADSNSGTGNLGLSGSGLEERLYGLQDPNWNVVAISNTSGSVQERYCYDAYGRSTVLTGVFGSRATSNYDWETRYTGRPLDKDTGFQDNRNRWDGLHIGRWLSRDPIGYDAKDLNVYRYVRGKPTIAVDPTGKSLDWPLNYGNYCGAFRKAACDARDKPSPSNTPIDTIDAACVQHDCCLPTWRDYINPCRQFQCNYALCTAAYSPSACADAPDKQACVFFVLQVRAICTSLFGSVTFPPVYWP